MSAHQRYIQYRKDELYHYNHNHDPKTGRFTSSRFYTSVPDIVSHLKDVESIYDTLSDKDKHFLVGDRDLPKHFFEEGEQVPAALSITSRRGKPLSFALAYEDGNGEVSVATATDPNHRGRGYGTAGIKQIDDWFVENPSDSRKTLIWLARNDNDDSVAIAKKYGYEFETENDWGGWSYYRKDREPIVNDFTKARQDVMSRISNDIGRMQHLPPKKADVKKRGRLDDAEAETCIKLAVESRRRAKDVESHITSDVVKSVTSSGSSMYGLENRMKQATSLAAKIGSDAKEKKVSFDEAARNINDVIRYTSVADNLSFTDNYRKTKQNLEKLGYKETKCKNYFQQYRDGKVKHKAVQCTYESPTGYRFEIQFHTPDSQTAKELKIPIYEKRRRHGLSEAKKKELERQMDELAQKVPFPKNVFTIKQHAEKTGPFMRGERI